MHMWLGFKLTRPSFDADQLEALQQVINDRLPHWASRLRVAKDEDAPDGAFVDQTHSLYDCIYAVARPKYGLGDAALSGAYAGVSFYVDHCNTTYPPVLNDMSIELVELTTVEGQAPSQWARGIFEAIVSRLPVRHGFARLDEEYYAKNMIDDETGVRAIGADIIDAVPGLYWLNYFGAPYLDLMGRERLLTSPAYEVKPSGEGFLLSLEASPDAWLTAAYRLREAAVIAHLGEQFFFSRHDPDRKTIAPDFRGTDS
jgi:hypothetical protein